ncbi:MAG: hypothetical protein J6K95_06905 [Rikenellaceae bacterium]|nr:hypothetical protein [Rikenellaceae bacterium]
MLQAGHYYTLSVGRISDHGLYLTDADGEEVLLPNRYVSLADKPGDTKEVFVYHDSEDRLVATTERPLATVGQAAFLKVVDKTIHGAFLGWGLSSRDIFLPNRNQQYRLEVGQSYVVYLYNDNVTGRVVATTKLNGFISNEGMALTPKQRVEILVARQTPVGYRVVIDDRHWGMIYSNQIFKPIAIGDRLTGYVRRITDDLRVDIGLQQEGYDEVKSSATTLLALVRDHGGYLPVGDRSTPEEVYRLTGMSKKVFKRSLGMLLKSGEAKLSQRGGIEATRNE